jgi:hypothetical protein
MALLEPGVRLNQILDRLGGGGEGGGAKPVATRPAAAPPARVPEPRRRAEAPAAPAPSAPTPTRTPVVHTDADWDAPGLWERVVTEVKDRKLMVGVFLAESRRAGWDGTSLRLAADEVHRSLLEARENRELLGEVMARVYGRPLAIRFLDQVAAPAAPEPAPRVVVAEAATEPAREMSAATATLEAVAEPLAAPVPSALEPAPREAAVSPEVQQAMVWFEGDIVRRADSGGAHP